MWLSDLILQSADKFIGSFCGIIQVSNFEFKGYMMPVIKVLPHDEICPNGAEFDAEGDKSVCKVLLEHGIEIEHACDMSCACTTCHVIIRRGFDSLNELNELEEDLLDRAWGLTAVSRLSCQAKIGTEDLTIEIPKYTINHAKEG